MSLRRPGSRPHTPRWATSTAATDTSYIHPLPIGGVDLLPKGDDKMMVTVVRVLFPVEGEEHITRYAAGPFAVEVHRTSTDSALGLIGVRAPGDLAALITEVVTLIERIEGGRR